MHHACSVLRLRPMAHECEAVPQGERLCRELGKGGLVVMGACQREIGPERLESDAEIRDAGP